MRVAVVVSAFPMGTETFLRDHIDGLSADVVAVRASDRAIQGWEWERPPEVFRLTARDAPTRTVARRILSRVQEALLGLPTPQWPPGMSQLWDGYVRERSPDVVLAEYGPNGICALESCRRHGLPLVVHFHGYDASALLRAPSYCRSLPALFDYASRVIVVSRPMRDRLASLGCDLAKIDLIRCGVRQERFTQLASPGDEPCRFLTVSSFAPKKGPLQTLKAFGKCAEVVPDATLTMYGTGRLHRAAKRWVRGSRARARIQLPGAVSFKDVPHVMQKASVFVQHSLVAPRTRSEEGSPVAIAEAAVCGLPVLSTRHAGIPELVIEGETGHLVPEGDWELMGDRMITLAQDPKRRRSLGLAARNHALKVANQAVQIDRLRQCLAGCVAGSRQ